MVKKPNKEKAKLSRSISFEKDILEQVDQFCMGAAIDRSEFVNKACLAYFLYQDDMGEGLGNPINVSMMEHVIFKLLESEELKENIRRLLRQYIS